MSRFPMWTDIMSGGSLLLPSGDKKMKVPISLLGTIEGGWDALLQADKVESLDSPLIFCWCGWRQFFFVVCLSVMFGWRKAVIV